MSAICPWQRPRKKDLWEHEQDRTDRIVVAARRHLGRLVNLRSALGQLGFQIRSTKSADCVLCEGDSTGTITFTQRTWHCHRCNEGGDIYALAQAVRPGAFVRSLVAELVEISREDSTYPHLPSRSMARRDRQQVSPAVTQLAEAERNLRLECLRKLRHLEIANCRAKIRLAEVRGTKAKTFTGGAQATWTLIQGYSQELASLHATYALLSFGSEETRARFVLSPESRSQMIDDVLKVGSLRTRAAEEHA